MAPQLFRERPLASVIATYAPSSIRASLDGVESSEFVRDLRIKRARARPNLLGFCVGPGRNGGAGCPSRSAESVVGLALRAARACGDQTALRNGTRTGANKDSPAPAARACCLRGTPCPRAPALADRRARQPVQLSVLPIARPGCWPCSFRSWRAPVS